jgi:hypothetical protein
MSDRRRTSASTTAPPGSSRRDPRSLVLNVIIGGLALLVVLLGYSFAQRVIFRPPVQPVRAGGKPGTNIQLDVLNGSGLSGAGITMTSFLRARGFDVVEIRNYKSSDVAESMVIDRTGDRENAERVAYAIGIKKENIVHQINEEYFVDVSVVIGRDIAALKPSQ